MVHGSEQEIISELPVAFWVMVQGRDFFSSLSPGLWTLWHWKVSLPLFSCPAFPNYCSVTFSQKTLFILSKMSIWNPYILGNSAKS